MDVERIIDEIEQLQEMFEAPDIRPLTQATSLPRIEGMTRCSPIVRGSWQHYDVFGASLVLRLGEMSTRTPQEFAYSNNQRIRFCLLQKSARH